MTKRERIAWWFGAGWGFVIALGAMTILKQTCAPFDVTQTPTSDPSRSITPEKKP